MAKYAGLVGYVTQEQKVPGVWSSVENPRMMKGDILRQYSTNQDGSKVNGDVSFNHRISLIGDAYSFANYFSIKWIQNDNIKWKVTSIEIQRPRIIVSLGGVYNG